MSDDKELEDLMGKYTPEQVEMFQKLATLQYSQATYAQNLAHNEESNIVEIQQKRSLTRLADYQVELVKDSMRPHVSYKADIGQDITSGAYYCKLPAALDIFGDDEDTSNIVAYGSTPAEACDNFDTLWVQGRYKRGGGE